VKKEVKGRGVKGKHSEENGRQRIGKDSEKKIWGGKREEGEEKVDLIPILILDLGTRRPWHQMSDATLYHMTISAVANDSSRKVIRNSTP